MRMGSPIAAIALALLPVAASPVAVPSPLDALFAPGQGDTRAALMIVGGHVVAKHYASGYSDANRFISWSMAKTLTAMIVGALVADGRLRLDDPAPITQWHGPGDPRAAITLRHLLNMASGLRHIEVGEPVEASDTNQMLFVSGTADMAARAIDVPLEARPGTRFRYSSLTSLILAEIVTRALTASRDPRVRAAAYRDFAQANVLGPAGIDSAVFDFDGRGTQIGGSIVYMSLDDWGRFGDLLLDGKGVGGRQVIAPDWLAFMKAPSPNNAEYGAQTWLNRPGGADGTPSLFPAKAPATLASANGHIGQFVMASPDSAGGRGMVLVRLGNTREDQMRPVVEAMGDIFADAGRPAVRAKPPAPIRSPH